MVFSIRDICCLGHTLKNPRGTITCHFFHLLWWSYVSPFKTAMQKWPRGIYVQAWVCQTNKQTYPDFLFIWLQWIHQVLLTNGAIVNGLRSRGFYFLRPTIGLCSLLKTEGFVIGCEITTISSVISAPNCL